MPTTRTRIAAAFAVSVTLAFAAAGCGTNQEKPMLTHQQATDEVERLVHDVAGTIAPTARLEPNLPNLDLPCSGPNDIQRTNNHMVERSYWLRDIPPVQNDTVYQAFLAYIKTHKYTLARDDWANYGGTAAKNPANNFTVVLHRNNQESLYLLVDSTCVPNLPQASPTNR